MKQEASMVTQQHPPTNNYDHDENDLDWKAMSVERNNFFQIMKQEALMVTPNNYDNNDDTDTDTDWKRSVERNILFQTLKQEASMVTPQTNYNNDDTDIDWKMSVSAFFQWVTQPFVYILSAKSTTRFAPSSTAG